MLIIGKNKKEFIRQINEALTFMNTIPSFIMKDFKANFKKYGIIYGKRIVNDLPPNPWNNYIAKQADFDYASSTEQEQLEFLIYSLYSACASSSGFTGFFENTILHYSFSYKRVNRLLGTCELLSFELRKLTKEALHVAFGDKKLKFNDEAVTAIDAILEENYDRKLDAFEPELEKIIKEFAEKQ